MLQNLNMEEVGEAADWTAVSARVPETQPDILLVDWEVLPLTPAENLTVLRQACKGPFFVVLTSFLDARQQAAIAVGADTFISKFEAPDRLADRLQLIAKYLDVSPISKHPEIQQIEELL
jgi:DNA-binding NarL/FixJ family response regulator